MKKLLVAFAVCVMIGAAIAPQANAQLGVGVKVPPLVLPNLFLSYQLDEHTLLEAMAALHLSTGVSGISGGLVAKLYMDPWMLGEIALEPFLGAGAGVAIISVGLFGTTTTVFGVGVSGLGGLEYTFADTPFSVFAEIGLSVSVLPSIGFGALVDLGIRFDFPASVEAPL